MFNIHSLQQANRQLGSLLEEREQRMIYNHYINQNHFIAGERIRAPFDASGKRLRKSSLVVANCVAVPVRYNDNLEPTHVLCWVPETDIARWLCLKDWRFKMKDLDGIPEQLHFDVTTWKYGDR